MKKKKASISTVAFRVRYLRRSREIYRLYLETKPWIRQLYTTFLDLKPGVRIVDVGCGTGDFTRYLAGLIPGRSKIIGVDMRAASLRSATVETKKAGFASKISYRKGDAYQIPVKDGWADLVCCRTLLMHLTDPVKAVREMTRVARKGGLVAAVERGMLHSFYVPGDDGMTRLGFRLGEAHADGVHKLEGKYFSIGERLPTIFHEAGLRKIAAEVQADAYLSSDPRRRIEDIRDELRFEQQVFKETRKVDTRAMLAGGASKKNVDRYHDWYERKLREWLGEDDKLLNDTTFAASGLFIVAGRKP